MRWVRKDLRGKQVFVRVDDEGNPEAQPDGRVDILYKLDSNAKVYRALVRNLTEPSNPTSNEPVLLALTSPPERAPTRSGESQNARETPAVPPDSLIIYTDGACTGNPGPMGVGVVIVDGDKRWEISEFLGHGTNNIAELTAIETALRRVVDVSLNRTVVLHTDSAYSVGLLTKNWKAKANSELVAKIRDLVAQFADLRFVKVKGHSGVPENERCDELATAAILRR